MGEGVRCEGRFGKDTHTPPSDKVSPHAHIHTPPHTHTPSLPTQPPGQVLGVLRCNWSEVSAITGVDVTPVVGFIGNLDDANVQINADEVQEFFTVPLSELLNRRKWVRRSYSAPVFTGADNVIWGLTAYVDKEEQKREEKRYSKSLFPTYCAVCNVQCVRCNV